MPGIAVIDLQLHLSNPHIIEEIVTSLLSLVQKT